jgi:hypothetical protein
MVLVAAAALLTACGTAPEPAGTSSAAPTPSGPSPSAPVAGCPPGSTPDQPGDADQPRPALRDWYLLAAPDPSGPRIIAGETGFVPEGSGTATLLSMWAFDLCRNAWTELDDVALPPTGSSAPIGQLVTDQGAGRVLGLVGGLAPVWSYDPGAATWSAVEVSGGGSDEAWPMAAYDPDGDRLLAFDGNLIVAGAATGTSASGVLSLDLADGAWTGLELVDPEAPVPRTSMAQYAVAYDSAARRLVLVVVGGDAPAAVARTWTFDPRARTWSRGADVPRTLPGGYPDNGFALAFDPTTARTWAFGDTAMLGYDATADDWVVAERDGGWPGTTMLGDAAVDPVARSVSTMVVDQANGRLIVISGRVREAGGTAGGFVAESAWLPTDDVWAYHPATNTWTLLLGPSAAPASYGPG